jgi:hypothetical protein
VCSTVCAGDTPEIVEMNVAPISDRSRKGTRLLSDEKGIFSVRAFITGPALHSQLYRNG